MYRKILKLLPLAGLVLVAVLLATSGVTAAPADGQIVPGQYVVTTNGVDPAAVAADHGIAPRHVYGVALDGFAAAVPDHKLPALQADPRVLVVEPERIYHIPDQPTPTGVDRIETDKNPNADIDQTDDVRVDYDVAIIDTGIDKDHSDLNVAGGRNFSGGPASNWDDGNGHGTHVAGSVGAIDNGSGVVGVAPGARVWGVKVCKNGGICMTGDMVAGIDWVAERKAGGSIDFAVANMSISTSDDPDPCTGSSGAVHEAICGLVSEGVVFSLAAGNDNRVKDAFPEVLAVSALADFDGKGGGAGSPTCRDDEDETLANFSNYGSEVDITAPGVCIRSTWNDGGYNTISGTSMAAPHVAGAVALYLHANGLAPATDGAGVDSIEQAILDAALPEGTNNDECSYDNEFGSTEPLLFVNATAFGGDGSCDVATSTTDDPPTVTITNPNDGDTVSGTVTVTADATDDNGVDQVEFFVDGSSIGTDIDGSDGWSTDWDTTTVSDGDHTVTAEATDTAGQTAQDSITVTVDNGGGGGGGDMYVWDIAFSQKDYGPGGSFHDLMTTVTIQSDSDGDGVAESSDDVVSDASVDMTLTHDTDGDGAFECGTDDDCWNFGGTTDSSGQVTFTLKRAPTGGYQAEVTNVTHSSFTWNSSLDADNPDTYTLQ